MTLPEVKIGVIGGSGLYHMPAITDVEEYTISTPFGNPSDALLVGQLAGVPVAFLARHGGITIFCRRNYPPGRISMP